MGYNNLSLGERKEKILEVLLKFCFIIKIILMQWLIAGKMVDVVERGRGGGGVEKRLNIFVRGSPNEN